MRSAVFQRQVVAVLIFVTLPISLWSDEPEVSMITTGWNAPTMGQFARDWKSMPGDAPLTGSVLTLHNDSRHSDSGKPDPMSSVHSRDDWSQLNVNRSIRSMVATPQHRMGDNYLLLKANPGDIPWDDDAGWETIVDHYRVAASIARRAQLRGILIDFEPYSPPYRPFQYSRQSKTDSLSFADYQTLARQRGREVMKAIADEFPRSEIYTFFLLSYLTDDHHYRGPSPIGRSDAKWCLEGHSYGLLPAFVDGWLDQMPETITLIDGCENAYWFTSQDQFQSCAAGVRDRSERLLSPENRAQYRRRIRVAFPIFLDAIHPSLAGPYTLQPHRSDRLTLLKRNLTAALKHSDSRVWLYGERGRWWPEAAEEALWVGKDVYPTWETLLPGISRTLQQSVQEWTNRSGRNSPTKQTTTTSDKEITTAAGQSLEAIALETDITWKSGIIEEQMGIVNVEKGHVTIRGAKSAHAEAVIRVDRGKQYMIQLQVVQEGRGLTKLVVQWSRKPSRSPADRIHDVVAYPGDEDPLQPRTITAVVRAPDPADVQNGTIEMVVRCYALRQPSQNDGALFGNLMVGTVIEKEDGL